MQALESECPRSHPGFSTSHSLDQVTVTPGVMSLSFAWQWSLSPRAEWVYTCRCQLAWCLAHRECSVSTRVLAIQLVTQLLFSWRCGQEPGSFASDPERRLGFRITWNTAASRQEPLPSRKEGAELEKEEWGGVGDLLRGQVGRWSPSAPGNHLNCGWGWIF